MGYNHDMVLALEALGRISPEILSWRKEGIMNLVFMFLDVWSGLSYFFFARPSSFEMAFLSASVSLGMLRVSLYAYA